MMDTGPPVSEFIQALLALDRVRVAGLINRVQSSGKPLDCIDQLIVPALEQIGTAWEQGTVALSQVYMSGRICEELVERLLPLGEPVRVEHPRIAIAVLNDHHLLGKRIVYSILRAAGYVLRDYGQVNVGRLVQLVHQDGIEILLISTLMLPSSLLIRDVRTELDRGGLPIKIIVGGAPFRFDEHLWKEVGADAMGSQASEAVALVQRLTEEISPCRPK
jgi:methanogenic corrinoid protein MtbC1